jgi:hypothetical protein
MVYMAGALDAGTFVYATAQALAQLRRAADDESVPADQRQSNLLRVMGQLALQGVLLIGSNRDLFRGMPARGTGPPGIAGALAAGDPIRLPPDERTRVVAEMQRLGVREDLSGLSDVTLMAQYQRVVSRAHGDAEAAARATTAEQYVEALRRPGSDPASGAGGNWDYTRFDGYPPGESWRPGDPVDAPHQTNAGDWIYPDYNSYGRPRYWRNRAHFELESRRRTGRAADPDSSDPISAMSDADLQALRNRPNGQVRSPRNRLGQVIELEHSGVPQRVATALTELGLSASEARRLTGASDPGNLMDVTPLEHAFFDAYAQYMDAGAAQPQRLNRGRVDASGQTFAHTLTADERIQRPLSALSDGQVRGLVDLIGQRGLAPNFGRSHRTQNLRNWLRREIRERGLTVTI